MKLKRKIISVLLITIMLTGIILTLAGCGNAEKKDDNILQQKSNEMENVEEQNLQTNMQPENSDQKEDLSNESSETNVKTIQEGNTYKVLEINDTTNAKYYTLYKENDKFTSWKDYKNNTGIFMILDDMKPSDIDSMWNETGYIGFYDVKTKQYAIVYWIENSQKPYRAYIFTEQNGTIVNNRVTSEIYIDDIFVTSDKDKHAPVSYAPDISGSWEGKTGNDLVKISIYTEGSKKIFTLDYYPDNNNHFTEEVTGEWKTEGFEVATGLALYEFYDITIDNYNMTFSVKKKMIIEEDAKSIMMKDATYKVQKNGGKN